MVASNTSINSICENKGLAIINKLGEGGQGKIFSVKNIKTEELSALKILSIKDSRLKRFQNEIEIMQCLRNSERIIKLQKAFYHAQNGFIVMEKSDIDLMDYILNNQKLSETDTKFLFKQICESIKYCHDHNIAHMDLKPENILITYPKHRSEKMCVKLCDFGHAVQFGSFLKSDTGIASKPNLDDHRIRKRKSSVPNSFSRFGTEQYRAPELNDSNRRSVDIPAADIWSLGIVLFVMLTGFFPYVVIDKASYDYEAHSEYPIVKEEEDSFVLLNYDLVRECASKECFDLLDCLLVQNPDYRININDVLRHSWFTGIKKSSPIIDDHCSSHQNTKIQDFLTTAASKPSLSATR